jgi:S-adenosylmethionine:tRNA ribosyltransferase-isomerase
VALRLAQAPRETMGAEEYTYSLPKELIADAPAEPRDSSRLFVYDTARDEVILDTFADIARHLPSRALLVLNDTKVVPARLSLKRHTGGAVDILFLFNEWDRGAAIKGLPSREVPTGEELFLDGRPVVEAVSHEDEEFTFKLLVAPAEFEEICQASGTTPLPPYIHSDMKEPELRERYQTVFAAAPSSVAAPTASLHFTDKVFRSLDAKDIRRAYVTLHVGRGTFSPVNAEQAASGALHAEPVHVSPESARLIAAAKEEGSLIVAAGTTAARALESAAGSVLAGRGYDGETTLFIRPPYDFKAVDALITNFHLPGTSLLMLLDAFLQRKGAKRSWRELYERAVAERFRFYSFGDAMLVI